MKLLGFAVVLLATFVAAPVQAAQDQPAQNPTPQNQVTPPAASSVQAAAARAIDPAKEADIRRLLDLLGTAAMVDQVVGRTEQSLNPVLTNSLPPGDYRDRLIQLFFEKFNSKFTSQQILNLAVARYDENFSDEEIKGLIDFYQTPLGRKVATVLPTLMAELQEDGGKMGRDLGRESMMEVLQEHPDLRQALQEAVARRSGAPTQ